MLIRLKNVLDRYDITESNTIFGLLIVLASLMPFDFDFLPAFEFLIIFIWLVGGNLKEKINNLKTNKYFWLVGGFYFLHVLSLLYTSNISAGIKELEFKIRFISFSMVLFSTTYLTHKRINIILWFFVIGVLSAFTYCCYVAYNKDMLIFISSTKNYATYTRFITVMTPNGSGMHACLAIAILFYFLFKSNRYSIKILSFILVLLSSLAVYLYYSKAGLITMLVVYFSYLLYFVYMLKVKKVIKWTLLIVSLTLLPIGYNYLSNNTKVHSITESAIRLVKKGEIDEDKISSNNLRLIFWKTTTEIIKKNWLIGVGVGDVLDELNKLYKEKNDTGKAYQHINTYGYDIHSSFFEVLAGMGIIGLAIFLLIALYPSIKAFKKKDILLLIFIFIIYFNNLSETFIRLNRGLFIFGFFYALLIYKMELKNKEICE